MCPSRESGDEAHYPLHYLQDTRNDYSTNENVVGGYAVRIDKLCLGKNLTL